MFCIPHVIGHVVMAVELKANSKSRKAAKMLLIVCDVVLTKCARPYVTVQLCVCTVTAEVASV